MMLYHITSLLLLTMFPPNTRREKKDLNRLIYALHKYTDISYGKIAKAISISKTPVQRVGTKLILPRKKSPPRLQIPKKK